MNGNSSKFRTEGGDQSPMAEARLILVMMVWLLLETYIVKAVMVKRARGNESDTQFNSRR